MPEHDQLRETIRRMVRDALAAPADVLATGATSGGANAQVDRGASPQPAPRAAVRVAIGSDHSAFALKQHLVRFLRGDLGLSVEDVGTHSLEPVDYPDIAAAVATAVRSGRAAQGILLDGAGIGSTMAANKISGIRAALCHDLFTVRNSREHNDANVLVLGSNVVSRGTARRLVQVWLNTQFAGGRHARRVDKIAALDRSLPAQAAPKT
jgi:ribose 5-phosphate isomerase B